jgi:hypothetical protein
MVDFTQESTITQAPYDVVKIMILEKWSYVTDSIESYTLNQSKGISIDVCYIKARLLTLFNILYGNFDRELSKDDLSLLQKQINSNKFMDLLEAYYYISRFLDKKQLTRIDTKKTYDSRMVENENRVKKI